MFDSSLPTHKVVEATACRSVNAYMAKTINAFVVEANNDTYLQVSLIVQLIPWSKLDNNHPCFLLTQNKKLAPNPAGGDMGKPVVIAKIRINPHCSRSLVKFAIAHELYHLFHDLCDLKQYKIKYKTVRGWVPKKRRHVTVNMMTYQEKLDENHCNFYATELCRFIHKLNMNFGLRKKFKSFPSHVINNTAKAAMDYIEYTGDFKVDSNLPPFFQPLSYEEIIGYRSSINCNCNLSRQHGDGKCDPNCQSKQLCQYMNI